MCYVIRSMVGVYGYKLPIYLSLSSLGVWSKECIKVRDSNTK